MQSSTTITFAGPPDPPPGIGRSPITVSGVTFTNNEARLITGSVYLWNFDSSYPVGIFLPNGKNAFAADFSDGIVQNNPFNRTIAFNLLDGQTYTRNLTGQLGSWTFMEELSRSAPWFYTNPKGDLFLEFCTSRGREGPEKRLADFQGTIQTDAYAVYSAL